MKRFSSLLLFSLFFLLGAGSCFQKPELPYSEEGFFQLVLSPSLQNISFSSIEAVGSSKSIPLKASIELPFNANSDTVTYYFRSSQRPTQDTLILSYKRRFDLEKPRQKGFVLYLSNQQVLKNTLSRAAYFDADGETGIIRLLD